VHPPAAAAMASTTPKEDTALLKQAPAGKMERRSSVDQATYGLWGLWSGRTDVTPLTPTMRAAWLIEEAVRGLPVHKRPATTPVSMRQSYLVYMRMENLYQLTLIILLILTFLEAPLWCLGTGDTATAPFAYNSPSVTCPAPDGGFIYLSQLPYVPVGIGAIVELLCYTVWLIRAVLVYGTATQKTGGKTSTETRLWQIRLAATTIAIVDTIIYATIIAVPGTVPTMRLAPFMRFVHIGTLDAVWSMFALLPNVVPPFASIFVIYAGMWTMLAWVFCLLLDDATMPVARCAAGAEAGAAAAEVSQSLAGKGAGRLAGSLAQLSDLLLVQANH